MASLLDSEELAGLSEEQKIETIKNTYPDLTDEVAKIAIKLSEDDEFKALERLGTEKDFREQCEEKFKGEKIEQENHQPPQITRARMPLLKDEEYVSNEQSDDDDYDCPAYHTRRKKSKKSQDKTSEADYEYDSDSSAHKKRRTIPRLTLNEALSKLEELDSTHRVFEHKDNMFSQQNADDKNNSSSSSPISEKNVNSAEAKNENSEETSSTTNTNNANNNSNNSKSIKNGNSKKKPNLPKSVKHFSSQDLKMLGWSDARIRAWNNKDKNPNAYYYRFNDPGIPQATGPWTEEEKRTFMNNIKQRGVNYEWGTFSMNIPGRVGYQCSNYYRALIQKGEIEDKNYYFENGKLKFKFHSQEKDNENGTPKPKKNRQRRRTTRAGDTELYLSDEDENDNRNSLDNNVTETNESINLLPDMTDPITCTAMVQPAISPYGHVMDYQSWLKVLMKEPKNVCPFTKQKLTHRMLVKLTIDNIEDYRDKIIKDNKLE